VGNLTNYRVQLQQVDAALTSDPDNEDLVKLKNDLEEVITLTEDLVRTTQISTQPTTETGGDGLRYPGRGMSAGGSRDDEEEARAWLRSDWKSGDKCRAPWTDSSGETQFYSATVDEILDDGSCSVIFERYGSTEVTQVALLQPLIDDSEESATAKPKTKKDLTLAQREYKKKKAQKKAQRLKQHEDEREEDKNKWLSFNSKVFFKDKQRQGEEEHLCVARQSHYGQGGRGHVWSQWASHD